MSLVLHWLGIGDIVVCGSLLRGLENEHPNKKIRFYLQSNEEFDVHRLLPWAQLVWEDCSITDDGEVPGRKLEIGRPGDENSDPERQGKKGLRHDLWAELCGIRAVSYTIRPDETALESGREFLAALGVDCRKPLAYFSPVTANRWRNWPIERWQRLEKQLSRNAIQVLIGALKPEPWATREDLDSFSTPFYVGRLEPSVMLGVLHLCDAIVSNDSGFAHLGGVLDKHTVAVCGGNYDGFAVFGFYDSVRVVQAPSRSIGDVSVNAVVDAVLSNSRWTERKSD